MGVEYAKKRTKNDALYYGAMTPIETNIMRYSTNKLKIKYNDMIYHVYDITTIAPM